MTEIFVDIIPVMIATEDQPIQEGITRSIAIIVEQ